MNMRTLPVAIGVLILLLIIVNIAEHFIEGYNEVHTLILTIIIVIPTGYLAYRHSIEMGIANKILSSNLDLHERYEEVHIYNASKNGMIDLFKNLQEIQAEYKDYFDSQQAAHKEIINYIIPQREKIDGHMIFILHPHVLTLPHDLGEKMMEAFGKDYRHYGQ